MKILKTDFVKTHDAKIKIEIEKSRKTMKITPDMILGRPHPLPSEIRTAYFNVLRKPLEKITTKANKQIKVTTDTLKLNKPLGVVLYVMDGFHSLDPNLIMDIIEDPITRHFSAVHGFIFTSLRRRVKISRFDDDLGYLPFLKRLIFKRLNSRENILLTTFIDQLGKKWFQFLEGISGVSFVKSVESDDPEILSSARFEK